MIGNKMGDDIILNKMVREGVNHMLVKNQKFPLFSDCLILCDSLNSSGRRRLEKQKKVAAFVPDSSCSAASGGSPAPEATRFRSPVVTSVATSVAIQNLSPLSKDSAEGITGEHI